MKSTEILNKIKTFLGEEAIEQETQLTEEALELAQLKLENGTVLEAEAFEAGNEIFIVTEDERVAVPVGEYQMEDGQILVVSEEGIIGEIKSAEAEESEEESEEDTTIEAGSAAPRERLVLRCSPAARKRKAPQRHRDRRPLRRRPRREGRHRQDPRGGEVRPSAQGRCSANLRLPSR